MVDKTKTLLKYSIGIALALFILRLIIAIKTSAFEFTIDSLCSYGGGAISTTTILAGIYERFLWRYNPFENTPKLAKKYIGIIKSSYDNLEYSASLEIKQTLLTVRVTLITDESRSVSLSSSIDKILGDTQLTYCYLNTPKTEFRHRSEIHYGTAMLLLNTPSRIDGQYYTDRQTRGDMTFHCSDE